MRNSLYEIKSLISRMYEIDGNYSYSDMLNEDRASKQSDKARRVIREIFSNKYNWDGNFNDTNKSVINTFEEYLRQTMKIRSKNYPDSPVSCEFEPGMARICYGELGLNPYNNKALWGFIESFRECMAYISENCTDEYDENLNGYGIYHFFKKYPDFFESDNKTSVLDSNMTKDLKAGKYTINQIDTFLDASNYKKYFSDNTKDTWCLTEQSQMFNTYSSNHNNKIYFCLADGFETLSPEEGKNYPYDRYGMSMICVIVDKTGKPTVITLRWNHHNAAPGDKAFNLDKSEFTSKTGIDFDSVFVPYTSEEKKYFDSELNSDGEITENDLFHLLNDGQFECDEVEEYDGGYKIFYKHKNHIYFDDDEGDWGYVNPEDSDDWDPEHSDENEFMPAILTENSFGYIVDTNNRKIIGRIEYPATDLTTCKKNFLAFVNNKVFSSAKRKYILNGIGRLRMAAGYWYNTVNGGIYVIDPSDGNVLNEKPFNGILFFDWHDIHRRSLIAFEDDENYLFLSASKKCPMDKLWLRKEDVLYNSRNDVIIFNKENKTCIYRLMGNKFRELNCRYTKIDNVRSLLDGTFSATLSNDSGETVFIGWSNYGNILISNYNEKEKEKKYCKLVSDNRFIVNAPGGGGKLFNIYNSKTKMYEFNYPFRLVNDSFCWSKRLVYLSDEKVYKVFNETYTKCLLTSTEEPENIMFGGHYCIFGLTYYDTPIKVVVTDRTNDDEVVPLNVSNPEFANYGVLEITDEKGNHDIFNANRGYIERPDEFKDKNLWGLSLERVNGGIAVVYTNKINGELHSRPAPICG